ncbi:MAG TPA: UDP-glucose 4-epimerase GalE [Pyrinomonadaceae bacterium]|jgi:UDP-glucose 4-epimerase|nr:UDP-glucose 4-epimerase GalE [Pyrinomonadaceae bacterium]
MNVLVTGGAGYIGSVVAEELIKDNHAVVVYDSLCKGHREAVVAGAQFVHADLADAASLRECLTANRIEAVIHMAADSLVGESCENPAKYYRNNVVNGLALLEAMRETDVDRIVFSSTAAIYGEPEQQSIAETALQHPTNPYGQSKLAFEQALGWYQRAYKLRFAALRYFNAAGASERCGEDHDPETHLIPIALQVAAGARAFVEVYGQDYPTPDGTCVRDYIHVIDLAQAHLLALKALDDTGGHRIYNLGCGGEGYSVNQVVAAARAVTGKEIPVRVGPRRAGDPAVLIASSEKIKRELGWQPQFQDLRIIIESAWRWLQAHPRGYAK